MIILQTYMYIGKIVCTVFLFLVVQPLPRNMPTLTLELDASKGLHLDAETKRHLKTLEDIR